MFDTMTLTKIVGAFCGALLVFLMGNWVAESIYATGGGHGEGHAGAYVIDTGEDEAAGGEEEAGVDFAALMAEADEGKGAKVFGKCKACHKLEEGANATGPYLYGVVGRTVDAVDGFGYSGALEAVADTWTIDNLNHFLEDPKGFAPGTKMTFAGLSKPEDRANVIHYLDLTDGDVTPYAAADGADEAAAADEGATDEAATAEAATADEGGTDEAAAQTEEPAAGDAAADAAVDSDEAEGTDEAAATDDTASEDAATEQAESEEAATEESATEQTAAEDAAAEDAATDEAATEQAATDEAATEQAATDDAATQEAATEDAATDEAATDDAATGDAATDEAAGETEGEAEATPVADEGATDAAAGEASGFAAMIAAADPADGEKVFKKCRACHKLEEGKNGVGPSLYKVVGRDVASVEGFNYSDVLAGIEGDWTPEQLDAYLTKPNDFAKGTKMTFAGLKKEEDRAAVIAYIESESE